MAVATGPYSPAELVLHEPDHIFSDLTDLPTVLAVLSN
jgi:phosphoglycolate phosphatase-like HAD superfamily hydrolase